MAAQSGKGNVFFVAVARMSDKAILGHLQFQGAIAMNAVQQMLGKLSADMQEKQHYAFEAGGGAWHLSFAQGLIFLFNTKVEYPNRVAGAALEELSRTFIAKTDGKWETAKADQLSGSCQHLFNSICANYDNLEEKDKISKVMATVDAVKLQMEQNIQDALANSQSLEEIENKAEELKDQSLIFKQNAVELKNKMWWKNLKMKLIIAAVVVVLVTVIALVIAAQTGAFNKNGDKK